MTKFLNILAIIGQLFPLILGFIRNLEEAFPQSGQGGAKLEMLRKLLESAFESIGAVGVTWAEIWPRLKVMIDSVVAMYNALGTFRKAPPPPIVSNEDPS